MLLHVHIEVGTGKAFLGFHQTVKFSLHIFQFFGFDSLQFIVIFDKRIVIGAAKGFTLLFGQLVQSFVVTDDGLKEGRKIAEVIGDIVYLFFI